MILIDEQNNAIHSTIPKNISKKLKPFLKEGQLYALSNFEVGTCNEIYRPIQNDHKIIFLPTTNIQELTKAEEVKNNRLIEELPRQFKPQRTIEEEMNNNRRTIIEILNMVWNSKNKETIFTYHGKITKIETGFGNY
ncbi:hypothetical protein CMV_007905 [Castanea mollissima]|uniref:Replication protein A 70 kDa DNA-binding subunit B/D first OB fold domain-containing protein n=1 Tax=Castanea mollissima TaxID=60419 RepID=A0A8J4RD68_9ROSI|nr:hypothetical protein CMV_007905 [Castanea mollissima]